MTCWGPEELSNYKRDDQASGVSVALAPMEGKDVNIYRIALSIVDVNVNQTVNSAVLLY